MKQVNLFFFSLALATNCALGANYYVNDNSTVSDVFCTAVGNNLNNGTSPATPKATLTNLLGIYSAVLTSGDTIFVDAGIYLSTDANLVLNIDGLAIVGAGMQITEFDNNFSSSDANRLFTITADNVYLSNFSVTGYNRGTGDAFAIQFEGVSGVIVENVLAYENDAGGGDAAIVVQNGSQITFNGGGSTCNSSLSIAGGGVNVLGAGNDVAFNGYTFKDNFKAVQNGSGLLVDGASSVTITNSIFDGNENSANGGGIFATGGCTITITGTCFANNSASSGASSTIYGGAISVGRGAIFNIDNCIFEGNSAPRGGAIAINTSTGSAGSDGVVNLTNCWFTANSASNRGIDLFGRVGTSRPAVFTISECTFTGSTDDIRNENSASITVSNSGSPSFNGTVTFLNTIAAALTPATSCPTMINPCLPTPLPVELLSFTGTCKNANIELAWQTASEQNNDFFTVERMNQNMQFEVLVYEQGSLNSTQTQAYQFVDTRPNPGINYYKLSQTDTDGTETELKIISVVNQCGETGFVFFDELTQHLRYQAKGDEIATAASLYSSAGQEVHLSASGQNEWQPAQKLSKGIYFMRVQLSNNVVESFKVAIH